MSGEREPWLAVGRVARPHGLDGSVHVVGPRARLLELGRSVRVGGEGGETRAIVRRAGTAERPIVRFAGVDGRTAAEALRGLALDVPRDDAPPLGREEWWAEDLLGCRVHDAGRELGTVRRLLPLPSCEVLEVERSGGGELLVPLIRDAVRSVDVEARRIDVDLRFLEPAGLAPPPAASPGADS